MSQGLGASFLPEGFSIGFEDDTEFDATVLKEESDPTIPSFSQNSDRDLLSQFTPSSQNCDTLSCSQESQRSEFDDDKKSEIDILLREVRKHNFQNENSDNGIYQKPFTQKSIEKSRVPFAPLYTNQQNQNHQNPVTPTKPFPEADPITPTANLKMLMSAVSPEIRNREKKKELFNELSNSAGGQSDDSQTDMFSLSQLDTDCPSQDDEPMHVSRKEKSLGLLCTRFISMYPDYPSKSENIEIGLDEVAKDLKVERRRIYDIVNVLESVEVVSRQAKNRYIWHGKSCMVRTLAKLKALAEKEGYAEDIEKMKEYELMRDSQDFEDPFKDSPLKKNDDSVLNKLLSSEATLRKDRSLGILSQRFLMLFLVCKPKTLNLDISAKILTGNPNIDRTESSKFKTKIRRLYDIANILTSLSLIKKVHVTDMRGRKPAFKYTGPHVDDFELSEDCENDAGRNPSKHSLLPGVEKQCSQIRAPLLTVTRDISLQRKSFSRHASFEQMCQVVESERDKLGISDTAKTGSERKLVRCATFPSAALLRAEMTRDLSENNTGKAELGKKQLVIIKNDGKRLQVIRGGIDKLPSGLKLKVPLKNVTFTQAGIPSKEGKLIKLNSGQFTNLQNSDEKERQANSVVHVQITKKDDSKQLNMMDLPAETRRSKRTIQQHHLGDDFEYEISSSKKLKTDDNHTQNDIDAEVAMINKRNIQRTKLADKRRPSPLRALHLDPEFRSSPPLSNLPVHQSPDVVKNMMNHELELASPLSEEMKMNDQAPTVMTEPIQESSTVDKQLFQFPNATNTQATAVIEKTLPQNRVQITVVDRYNKNPAPKPTEMLYNNSSCSLPADNVLSPILLSPFPFTDCTNNQNVFNFNASYPGAMPGNHLAVNQYSPPSIVTPNISQIPMAGISPAQPIVRSLLTQQTGFYHDHNSFCATPVQNPASRLTKPPIQHHLGHQVYTPVQQNASHVMITPGSQGHIINTQHSVSPATQGQYATPGTYMTPGTFFRNTPMTGFIPLSQYKNNNSAINITQYSDRRGVPYNSLLPARRLNLPNAP